MVCEMYILMSTRRYRYSSLMMSPGFVYCYATDWQHKVIEFMKQLVASRA